MKLPLISVMIPTYNQPQYIAQAVESALAQDYEKLEIVVSDDSTNDATEKLLQPYLADKRFSYFRNPAQLGRVANYRKLLFELAKGDWVVMLDGDDYYIDNSFISKAADLIGKHENIVLVGAGMTVLQETSGRKDFYGLDTADILFDGKEVFTKYERVPAHQTDIYPKKLAQQLDFYRDSSTASDSESLYRLCLRGMVAYMAKPVAVWRVHSSNTTYQRHLGKQINELVFIDKVYTDARKYLHADSASKWRKKMYISMSAHLLSMAFAAKQYRYVVMIVIRFGKYMGWKLSLVYLLQIFGLYKPPATVEA